MSVDGRVIDFVVEADPQDPLARALGDGVFPAGAPSELWRHLVRPEHKVIDVGAHLGTYSLPAAAVGAQVLAVEASPTNAALLSSAARANSFSNLHVVHAVAAAKAGMSAFIALGPWGHVAPATAGAGGQGVEVEALQLDEAVGVLGWDRIDLIKIDVEGFEVEALRGARRLLRADDAPALIIEANGHMLAEYGLVPADVIGTIERYGYACYEIHPAQPECLVPVDAGDIQPDCVADYFAFKSIPDGLAPWRIVAPYDQAEIIRRVVATCMASDSTCRRYGARLLEAQQDAGTSPWLFEDQAVKDVIRGLGREELGPASSAD